MEATNINNVSFWMIVQKLQLEMTDFCWKLIVQHWQTHQPIEADDLQNLYKTSEDHYLFTAYRTLANNELKYLMASIKYIDERALLEGVIHAVYENIAFLHSDNYMTTTDIMIRRAWLKNILKDRIILMTQPMFSQMKPPPPTPQERKKPATQKEKDHKEANDVAKPKPIKNNNKKDIIRSIEAEIGIDDKDQKERFNSAEYADLSDLLSLK